MSKVGNLSILKDDGEIEEEEDGNW